MTRFERRQETTILFLALAALIVMIFGGCASAKGDQIAFDRGAFALAYGDFTAALRIKCEKTPEAPACAKFELLDTQVRQAIVDAPKVASEQKGSPDFSQLFGLMMKLAPLAAMAGT